MTWNENPLQREGRQLSSCPPGGRKVRDVLSAPQREVAHLVALGMTTGEVAGELSLAQHLVEEQLAAVYQLLGVDRREQLIERLYR